MDLHVHTDDVRQSNCRKKQIRYRSLWLGSVNAIIHSYVSTNVPHPHHYYTETAARTANLCSKYRQCLENRKIIIWTVRVKEGTWKLISAKMPSVMNKPNLYLVGVFFNSVQGCDVTSSLFSLSEQTNLPELLFVYLPKALFFCFIMPERRGEAQRRREG